MGFLHHKLKQKNNQKRAKHINKLKEVEQLRIDFVANVSHEIRTPLTSIKGFADTLLEDATSGRPITAELITPIVRNCERLSNLINDLLDLSALDAQKSLEKEMINAREVTEKVFAQLQSLFTQKSQSANFQCEGITVWGDAHRIEQVLINLLDNASKYTPAGRKIEARWFVDNKNKTILEVKDNGPGIAPEHLERLFERFYRVDKGRSRSLGGTGLGLAIVKHIMMVHGGTVQGSSEVGKGSIFRCEFPRYIKINDF